MKTLSLYVHLAAIATCSTLVVGEGLALDMSKTIKVLDKSIEVRTAPGVAYPFGTNYHFVDEDRVVFLGASEAEHEEVERKRLYPVRIWNWRTGEIRTIDHAAYLQLCYDGQVMLFDAPSKPDAMAWKRGPIDNFQETAIPRPPDPLQAKNERGERTHHFYCRDEKWSQWGSEGLCRFPLRDGDGALDVTGGRCSESEKKKLAELRSGGSPDAANRYERSFGDRPVTYLATPESKPINLPILSREIYDTGSGISYSPFAGVYVLQAKRHRSIEDRGSWPQDTPVPVYLLKAGGEVTTVNLPYDKVLGGKLNDAKLSKRGLLALAIHLTRNGDWSRSGLYLLRDGRLHQLVSALAYAFQVSANGCSVAVDSEHQEPRTRETWRRISVIKLC